MTEYLHVVIPCGKLLSVGGREPTPEEEAKFEAASRAQLEYSFRQTEAAFAAPRRPTGMSRAEWRRQMRAPQ